MDPHTLELVGFPKVLQQLQESCLSEVGRDRLLAQEVSPDAGAVRDRLALAVAFRALLESGRSFPALDFPDVRPVLPKLFKSGAQLELEELFRLGRFVVSGQRLRRHIQAGGQELLRPHAAALPELKELSREIWGVVDREGRLRENQIPVLREMRNRIRALQREAERLARGYLDNPAFRGFWSADLPSEKNGRTVLPIRSSFKGRIQGIVHDVSASGATLYLEPGDIVQKNNDVTELEGRYRQEVHRILREVSGRVIARSAEIRALVEEVAELDGLYSRASFAISHRCHPAEPSEELLLNEGRHPLLGASCVPISLRLDAGSRVLIVTGPNTGGKTVTLKSVGLLAAMNQFGMEIPAQEDSRLPVFDNILADIGDEQSIEQSLSTFSAHIVNIRRIIEGSSADSLVLLDELGAGTDPEEGVAIAMGLLDHFIGKGCFCLATTHHGVLKNYGYTREGVENAAMDFDEATLQPTFHIIMGVPGQSRALEVARRTGIPETVLGSAARYLEEERGEAGKLIDRLSEKQRELLKAERQQHSREKQLREQRRETDLKELRLRQRELELREQGLGELRRFLRESRSQYERLLAELRGLQQAEERRRVEELLQRVQGEVEKQELAVQRERSELYRTEGVRLERGMEVIIRGTGKRGRILREGKRGSWIVATDTLRGDFSPTELIPAAPGPAEPAVTVSEELQEERAAYQLDVRGLRLEEALKRVEQQLDRAVLAGLREVSIVHGHGEGILQRGIHDYLRRSPHVEEYHFSTPEEGGFGRTVVRLRG
jgi:DNA mismatch repair protein MutS2